MCERGLAEGEAPRVGNVQAATILVQAQLGICCCAAYVCCSPHPRLPSPCEQVSRYVTLQLIHGYPSKVEWGREGWGVEGHY